MSILLRFIVDRLVRTLAALLLVALAPARAGHATELTLGVTPSGLSLPVDVARAQGYFAAEGVDVRVVDCSTGPRCLQQLFEGAAQLVTVSEMPVVAASFERADYAIVSTIATSTGNIRLLGRKSAGVTRPDQLAGKRIGVIVGSSSHYYLDAYLLFAGIDPKQVRTVPLQPETLLAAIQHAQVDAFVGYSRHVGPALTLLGGDAAVFDDPRIYTETYNLVVDRHTLAQRAGEVAKVLRALQRAERFIAEQPRQAKSLLRGRTGLDPAFVEAIFPSFTYRLSLDESLVATMEGQARWALREGHVAARAKIPNYLDFVEFAPLRLAVPTALSQ